MKYFLFSLLMSFSFAGLCQDFDVSKMNQFFDAIEKNNKGMGSLSLYHDGKEVYQRSIGYELFSQKTKSSKETRYRIGSISKSYTAAIIMQMVDEGKLQLDSKLSTYYPQFQNAEAITIEHLLRHRSGLFNFTNDPVYFTYMQSPHTQEALLEKLMVNDNNFDPGTKKEYSNTGYVLLSYIAEQVDDKSFSQIVADRITKPYGLKDTYYGGKIGSRDHEAQSYKAGKKWSLSTETDMSVPAGAGAIVSTPSDVNLFYRALFSGKIVSAASVDQMTTMEEGYGFGLFSFPFNGRTANGHTGGIDGFSSSAGHFAKDDLTICYISNGSDHKVNDIMIGVLSIYFGEEFNIPSFKPVKVPNRLLRKYSGVYSSPSFPLKITIAKADKTLSAQAAGQDSFRLTPHGNHAFQFDQAGIIMTFDTDACTMSFSQGGAKFDLTKE